MLLRDKYVLNIQEQRAVTDAINSLEGIPEEVPA